jgi:hypothetical protein
VGMARAFEAELSGSSSEPLGVQPGFFSWVDGAPAEGYRQRRTPESSESATPASVGGGRTTILTGEMGAAVLGPLLAGLGQPAVRVLPVPNRFFGGNIGVTGLLVGEDLSRVLDADASMGEGDRYLLPDVCLSSGRFLDGRSLADLPRPVEVVPTDGASLRAALGMS